MRIDTNNWHEILRATEVARYRAFIAYFCGDPEGNANTIASAFKDAVVRGKYLECAVCGTNLKLGHTPECEIKLKFEELFPVRKIDWEEKHPGAVCLDPEGYEKEPGPLVLDCGTAVKATLPRRMP